MAWVKKCMTVLLILFGKSCPLLQDYERIRNTLVLVKRGNGIYFSRSNVVNLIWRLFTESRSFFSTMTNEKELDSNILPITNFGSVAIIANCQPIRGDDLPLALMPTKLPDRSKGESNRNNGQMGPSSGKYTMTQQKGNGQQRKNGRKNESQTQVIFGPQFYHPMIRHAMLPVLEYIQYFSLASFLKRGNIAYQDLTPTERPKICSRMTILGKFFEGCTRDHCTIPNVWAKTVVNKVRQQIQVMLGGQGNDRRNGQSNRG